jgi:hypothetical protein
MDRLRTLAAPLLLAALALVAAPAPAGAAGEGDVVVMLTDGTPNHSDYISQNVPRRYRPADGDEITAVGSAEAVDVTVAGGEGRFTLRFGAPEGERLRPGRYLDVDRSSGPGRALLDVWGDGRGCSRVTGHVEVREVAVDAAGAIRRFWATFEQHCDGAVPALFGEVRVGMGAPATALATAPTTVRFPATDAGRASGTVPVAVVAPAGRGGRIASVALRGADAGRFAIAADRCTGATLPGGGACEVLVRFPAAVPGAREAVLRATGADGAVHDVLLQGHAWGGRTRVLLDSEYADYIGFGQRWSHGAADGDVMILDGYASRVGMRVDDDAQRLSWTGLFAVPDGQRLRPGRYADAGSWSFAPDRPGLAVFGAGRSCGGQSGEFTVNELTFDARGVPRTASVDFVQRCRDATAALRGTFEFRAGDTTPPAPWMTPGPPVPPASAPPAASPPAPAPSVPAPPATGPAPAPGELPRAAAPAAPVDASGPVPVPAAAVEASRATAPVATPAPPPALPAAAPAPVATPPTVDLPRRAGRATLARRGLAVAVSRLAPGARVAVAVRRGTRTLARAAATADAGGTARLRVRAPRAALGRAGAVAVVVTVRTPGVPGERVVRRVALSG